MTAINVAVNRKLLHDAVTELVGGELSYLRQLSNSDVQPSK